MAQTLALGGSQLAALPAGPQVLDLAMGEYASTSKRPLRGGRVVFDIRNVGTIPHELDFLQLPDDVQSIDAQLRRPYVGHPDGGVVDPRPAPLARWLWTCRAGTT